MLNLLSPTIHDQPEARPWLRQCRTLAARRLSLWETIPGCPGAGFADFEPSDPVTRLAVRFFLSPRHPDPRA